MRQAKPRLAFLHLPFREGISSHAVLLAPSSSLPPFALYKVLVVLDFDTYQLKHPLWVEGAERVGSRDYLTLPWTLRAEEGQVERGRQAGLVRGSVVSIPIPQLPPQGSSFLPAWFIYLALCEVAFFVNMSVYSTHTQFWHPFAGTHHPKMWVFMMLNVLKSGIFHTFFCLYFLSFS